MGMRLFQLPQPTWEETGWVDMVGKKCNATDHHLPLISSHSSLRAVASCLLRAPFVLQARGNNTQHQIKDELLLWFRCTAQPVDIPFDGIDPHSEKKHDMFLYFGLQLEGVSFSNTCRFVAKLYRAIITNLYKTLTISETEIIKSFIIKLNGQIGQWDKII